MKEQLRRKQKGFAVVIGCLLVAAFVTYYPTYKNVKQSMISSASCGNLAAQSLLFNSEALYTQKVVQVDKELQSIDTNWIHKFAVKRGYLDGVEVCLGM